MFGVRTIATCDKGWCSFRMVYIVPWNVHLQLFNLEIYCSPRTSVRLWIPSHSSEFSFNSLFVTLSSQWWIRLAPLLHWTVYNKYISKKTYLSLSSISNINGNFADYSFGSFHTGVGKLSWARDGKYWKFFGVFWQKVLQLLNVIEIGEKTL